VPRPGRPLGPVGAGGFGEAERRKLADGKRGQVLIQLRAGGNGAGQHNRCPGLGQREGQRDRVLGDAAHRRQRGQRRRGPARRSQPPLATASLTRTAHPAAAASAAAGPADGSRRFHVTCAAVNSCCPSTASDSARRIVFRLVRAARAQPDDHALGAQPGKRGQQRGVGKQSGVKGQRVHLVQGEPVTEQGPALAPAGS